MNIFQNSENLHDFKGCSNHSYSLQLIAIVN